MGGIGGSNVEQWGVYNLTEFRIPSEEELEHMEALILPGSKWSANDGDSTPWIEVLIRLIQNIMENHKHIKLVGLCFGA